MAPLLLCLLLFFSMAGHSSAVYCVCKDGVGDTALQKAIDYACGSGADCSGILQNGACYSPNTVKNHCDYAVNSYFQRKGQATGTCDFSGTATTSTSISTQSTGCVYQSSPGTTTTGGNTTGTTTTSGNNNTSTTVFGLGPSDSSSSAGRLLQSFTTTTTGLLFSSAVVLWFSGLVHLQCRA